MTHVRPAGYSPHARARSRRTAIQALYQWDMTQQPIAGIVDEFERDRAEVQKADRNYFREILLGIADHRPDLERELKDLLDRPLAELDPVERAILFLGIYELLYRPELPWRVIVNESIELGKMFGAEESHKYINGVLDAAARRIRKGEADARP